MPRSEVFIREEVLDKAIEVFWQKGYNGTSMQDLTESTGLNRSSIYNSFGSKLNLYLEVLKRYRSLNSAVFRKALMEGGNPLESLKKVFSLFMEISLADPSQRGCMVTNCQAEMSRQETNIKNWLDKNHLDNLSFFEDLVRDAQNQGQVNKEKSAEEYALYLMSSFLGIRIVTMTVTDKNQLTQLIDTIFTNLS